MLILLGLVYWRYLYMQVSYHYFASPQSLLRLADIVMEKG